MTKLIKPHPPHTPSRMNAHTNESKESEEVQEPKDSKAVVFPTTSDASPFSTPSKFSKFHRSSRHSTSSTSSSDNQDDHDGLRLRKPSLLKTVKRVSTKQLRSISSTLTNSAHRITLHGHGHGHHIDHSSESSESSQLSEPPHLTQSFDSSHLAPSPRSSQSAEHPELAEANSDSSSKDARRRRVSLPSFRLLRPSSYSRSRTGSNVGSVPSSTVTSPPVPPVPANLDIGVGRSHSSPSISTERNIESTVLSPVLASPAVTPTTTAATPTSPTPMAVSVSTALSADGEGRDTKDFRATSLVTGDDSFHHADAQEARPHPPGLLVSVELVPTSPITSNERAKVQTPSVTSRGVSEDDTVASLPPLPSSSRSVVSLSSFFSYTLPPSASPNHYSWTDDIDEQDGSENESEDEDEDSDDDSEEHIKTEKDLNRVGSHRVLEGPFISSVFILVPVFSVRRPIGFYLTWWLGRNV
ncbi:hypothetical protein F5879DRAFT_22676 [Lentinula edodes]|nr:hypothetical protein F5879DRAFT_22676 [Lentinula edodes]